MSATATPELFSRKASGLVRTAGALDVFIYNVGIISVGLAVVFNQFFGPAFYTGASIELASILTSVGMLFVALSFYFWSVIFPRSGGTYVFVTRGAHPLLGLALSVSEVLIFLFYVGVAGGFFVTVGLAPLFGVTGLLTGNAALSEFGATLSSPTGTFIAGGLVIVLCGALLLSGMRRFFAFQKWMFAIAILGTLISLGVLLAGSSAGFAENVDRLLAPLTYQGVIDAAGAGGWASPGFGWSQTIALMVWPLLPLLGAVFSMGIGGEIKQVERSQMIGMVGSVVFSGVLFALFAALSNRAFGYDFQGALAYNFLTGAAESTAIPPYFPLLAGVLTSNVLLSALIAVGFAAWIYFWIPGMLAYANRAMLAWSFDRFGPQWLGEVNSRSAVPTNAIRLSVLIAVVSLGLYTLTPFFATLQIFAANCLTWGIACLVGAAFPYTRPKFYNASPISRYMLGPIPLMTIVNLLGAGFLFWMFVLLWNDSLAAGHSPKAIGSYVAVLAVGLIFYFVSYTVRRRQGYDPTLPFKEIPIE